MASAFEPGWLDRRLAAGAKAFDSKWTNQRVQSYLSGKGGLNDVANVVGAQVGAPVAAAARGAVSAGAKGVGAVAGAIGRGAKGTYNYLTEKPPKNILETGADTGRRIWKVPGMAAKAYSAATEHVLPVASRVSERASSDLNRMLELDSQGGRTVTASANKYLKVAQEKLANPGLFPGGRAAPRGPNPALFPGQGAGGQPGGGRPQQPQIDPVSLQAFLAQAIKGTGEAAGEPLKQFSSVVGDSAKEMLRPSLGTAGYQLQRALFPVEDRIRASDAFAETGIKELSKQLATMGASRLNSLVDQGIGAGREVAVYGPQRRRIYNDLMANDEMLSRADPEKVLQAYHTLKRYAPLLSTDQSVASTFLRDAIMHEGAINYNTVGQLAKSEAEAQRALGGYGGR